MKYNDEFDYEDILENLEENQPFSFSRWGDGEWSCILGKSGMNCDKHQYFNSLGVELSSVLINHPEYHVGMQPKADRDMGKEIRQWLNDMGVKLNWCNADILHDASIANNMDAFFDVVNGKNWHLISSYNDQEIKKIPMQLNNNPINIPWCNAWNQYSPIKNMVFHDCDGAKHGEIFLFAAGMMSKVLIDDVYQEFGNRFFLIDVGSLLDPYAKRIATRKYHVQILERIGK